MTVGRIPSIEGGIQPTIVDAKGDLITAVAADTPARIAVGANNTVLTADSSTATGLKWAAPAGGGKVLQVVQASTTTETNIASTSYTDTTLTATITPTSATSNIIIFANHTCRLYRTANEIQGFFQILRGASSIRTFDYALSLQLSGSITAAPGTIMALTYLDSPTRTSATTYKVQAKVNSTADSGQYQSQYGNGASIITLLEIGA